MTSIKSGGMALILKEINRFCREKITGKKLYAVPKLWIPRFFKNFEEKSGKYFVDPYEFAAAVTDWVLKHSRDLDYSQPLSFLKGESSPDWIKRSVVYGSLPRTTTSYNHKGSGYFEEDDALGFREAGTFFKMILLLQIARGGCHLPSSCEQDERSFQKGWGTVSVLCEESHDAR